MTTVGKKMPQKSPVARLIGFWLDHSQVTIEDIRLGRPRQGSGPVLPRKLILLTVPFLQKLKPEARTAILDLDPRWDDAFEIWGGIRTKAPLRCVDPGASVEAVSSP